MKPGESATIYRIGKPLKPRVFTEAEQVIEYMGKLVLESGETYKKVAEGTGVSPSTITNLASGKTRWPRPTTLFPLMKHLGVHIEIRKGTTE